MQELSPRAPLALRARHLQDDTRGRALRCERRRRRVPHPRHRKDHVADVYAAGAMRFRAGCTESPIGSNLPGNSLWGPPPLKVRRRTHAVPDRKPEFERETRDRMRVNMAIERVRLIAKFAFQMARARARDFEVPRRALLVVAHPRAAQSATRVGVDGTARGADPSRDHDERHGGYTQADGRAFERVGASRARRPREIGHPPPTHSCVLISRHVFHRERARPSPPHPPSAHPRRRRKLRARAIGLAPCPS